MDAEQYFTNHNAYTYNILKLNYNDNIKLMNSKCGYIEIRKHVFDWINGAVRLFKLSKEARDLSFQMLDTYFRRHPIIIDDSDKSIDKKEVSFAATISLIFAARTIDSYCQLHLKNFSDMDNEELLQFQITYLTQLQFEIYPNMIPTSCINVLLSTWKNGNGNDNIEKKLIDAADIALIDFYVTKISLIYSPSCIALAAVITAFTMLNMDCTDFIKTIPQAFFTQCNNDNDNNNNNNNNNNSSNNNDILKSLINYEKCLEYFHKTSLIRKRKQDNLLDQRIDNNNKIDENSESSIVDDHDHDDDTHNVLINDDLSIDMGTIVNNDTDDGNFDDTITINKKKRVCFD